jgi:hypothetical protein
VLPPSDNASLSRHSCPNSYRSPSPSVSYLSESPLCQSGSSCKTRWGSEIESSKFGCAHPASLSWVVKTHIVLNPCFQPSLFTAPILIHQEANKRIFEPHPAH